jgi:hypothetical protein
VEVALCALDRTIGTRSKLRCGRFDWLNTREGERERERGRERERVREREREREKEREVQEIYHNWQIEF